MFDSSQVVGVGRATLFLFELAASYYYLCYTNNLPFTLKDVKSQNFTELPVRIE